MMTHTTQRSHEDNPQGPKVTATRDDPRAATIEEIQPIVDRGDQGYAETLTNRQVQMMAIGGAIGVGLFLGAGSRLRSAGPAVLISYAFCAVIAFLVMRALGELVIHRPSSGSFVSYARELLGDRWAYAVGWMYMLNWMTSGIAELTAIGTYLQFWWPSLPMWVPSLVALMILVSVNLISVKAFGEFEFWAALLKVVALTAFIIVAIGLVASHVNVGGHRAAVSNLWRFDGGFAPQGVLPLILVIQGVIFAYATIELVGTASGETQNPRKVIPKAVHAVVFRLVVFYLGSLALLAMLLPYKEYSADESPFVTAFSAMGVGWIGDAMNIVVITAAFSSVNSGLYATGRVLKSLAAAGEAPKFAGTLNRFKTPSGGILMTASVFLLGVGLEYVVPERAFEISINTAAVGVIWTWATIFWCQLVLRRRVNEGRITDSGFHMPGYPITGIFGIVSLAGVTALMVLDPQNRIVLAAALVYIAVMLVAWPAVKRNKARHPELNAQEDITF